MGLTSDEISATKTDEVNSSSSDTELPMEHEEVENIDLSLSAVIDGEQKQPLIESEEELLSKENSISSPSEENLAQKRKDRFKSRSVSFAPTVQEIEIPSRYDSSYSSSRPSIAFIDALVESYKLQVSNNFYPLMQEKKYVRKTNRTRLNPNWREHRTRHLMNKLEELSLWDREEELKTSQAQFLREQKLEQIQDRQRNHDLCLNLMRQRHESEMESAVLLDRVANNLHDENTSATIARAMNLASSANALAYDLPTPPPYILKRRVRQDQEKISNFKTPIGRYRQFETNMNNKLEKINQKLQPDWEIMRAYGPYHTSIPPTVVPLFSETYAALLSVPDKYSSNRYNQYHYGIASYLHQPSPSQHASSPDYETRLRSHSNRDVRVPLKEEINGNNDDKDDDNEYNNSRLSSSPSRRLTNLVSNTALSLYDYSPLGNTSREYSLIHSRQPISNSIHQRSLNDDLNAITQFSNESSKNILRNITESSNGLLTKNRSSSVPISKRVTFIDQDDDHDEENYNYHKSSRMIYQPELISLSSTR